MLIIIGICAVFTALFIFDSRENLNKFVDTEISSIQAIVQTIEQENSRRYRNRIKTFISYEVMRQRERIISAFARQDRDELLRLTTPFLKIFRKEDPNFSTFSWLTADNHAFLRVHRPENFGDTVSKMRSDIVLANKERQQYVGYMVSKTGLQYRLVQPVSPVMIALFKE